MFYTAGWILMGIWLGTVPAAGGVLPGSWGMLGDDGQGGILFYCTPERAKEFTKQSSCPITPRVQ